MVIGVGSTLSIARGKVPCTTTATMIVIITVNKTVFTTIELSPSGGVGEGVVMYV